MPINSIGTGCATYGFIEAIEWMRFDTKDGTHSLIHLPLGHLLIYLLNQDYLMYQNRINAISEQMDDYIAALREGVTRGYISSVDVCRNFESQITNLINSELDEFYAPLKNDNYKTIFTTEEQSVMSETIQNVKKQFSRFLDFYKQEYEPVLSKITGCKSLPNGDNLYAVCCKWHTTTDLTPAEIHQIGVNEVAVIESRIKNEVLVPLGFNNFNDFVEHVKTEPSFYKKNTEELLNVYRQITDEIYSVLPKYFNEIPRSPLEIVGRNNGPSAFYLVGTADGKRPGRFYVNCSHVEKSPTYEAVALALHEAIPGHHFQVSLALENERLPSFLRYIEDRRYEITPCRRNLYTSYIEGWALYCEHLGEEMGFYKSPYDLFGKFSMDMMRAVRLVVDTGIHYYGWSAEKAIEYFMEKTGMHLHEAEREIYRYCAWPGQALGYKIGQLEILKIRKFAETELGSKFDIKEFHSIVLSCPLPLNILKNMIDKWVESKK